MAELSNAQFEMPGTYEPSQVEQKWYRYWLEKDYFRPVIQSDKKPFVVIMPPPNVTGELHIGHALTATLEDIMVRWHRMKGEPTLWLPGVDHAGIATQVVVEQLLNKEGLTRHKLGRKKFIEKVHQWANQCRYTIAKQHQRLGASCDWSRERFTLDAGPSHAVYTVFSQLHKKGLIYRGERIINWCPRCGTALSELEVNHKEINGHLYYIRYPLKQNSGFLTLATTRPETILGDTAVAINPHDKRYRDLVGKTVILPIIKRVIPIIADDAVDPNFGSGVVKITPAHDPVDFEVAQRNTLPLVNILNPKATMNENSGPYQGLDRFLCREAILKDLAKDELILKIEEYKHSVGHCQRCGTTIEPIASKQWFVRMKPLTSPAIEAVTGGRIKIIPKRFVKVYLNWMENIRDWCISRQLWWGHQIPVWYCTDCNGPKISIRLTDEIYHHHKINSRIYSYSELIKLLPSHQEILNNIEWTSVDAGTQYVISETQPGHCPDCNSQDFIQDPDVLDTWFSSALWPHSTLGWPNESDDLRNFYPTSVMETAYDILFFWVARMIMMGIEDTGKIPFHTVYLHGLIRDAKGEKMSKTRGNVIDPNEYSERYGTDALRFALSMGITPGNDLKLTRAKMEAGRNFANKLWNATRFVLKNTITESNLVIEQKLPTEDRWILSRLNRLITSVNKSLEKYQFGEAQRLIHDFFWNEYCDWYIEFAKIRLRSGEKPSPIPVLVHVLETSLRLLHPYIPFITEELWHRIYEITQSSTKDMSSIMVTDYPKTNKRFIDPQSEQAIQTVIEIIHALRNVRAQHQVANTRLIEIHIFPSNHLETVRNHSKTIEVLARTKPLNIHHGNQEVRQGNFINLILADSKIIIPMESLIDIEVERQRLEKEIKRNQSLVNQLEAKLSNKAFLTKAPGSIVSREHQKLTAITTKLRQLEEQLVVYKGEENV